MKAYLNISLIAATMIVSSSVMAADMLGEMIDYPTNVAQPSNAPALTRAEVVAQIPASGVTLGEMIDYPQGYQVVSNVPSRTRAEVRNELIAAINNGTAPTGGIDYPGPF